MIQFGKTDIGQKRGTNQDTFAVEVLAQDAYLSLVCDGMGGASGGNVASATAKEEFVLRIRQYFVHLLSNGKDPKSVSEGDYSALLAHAVVAANRAVYDRARDDAALAGMGTTLVAALVVGGQMYVVNVGDSRLYLMTGGALSQVTRDHSLVQHLLDSGKLTPQEAKNYPNKNMITRAVGIEMNIEADILSVDLTDCREAVVLLCSDGLTNFVSDEGIHTLLQTHFHPMKRDEVSVRMTASTLIDAANANGGGDNITVVLMAYQSA